jgi:hypothetical protein
MPNWSVHVISSVIWVFLTLAPATAGAEEISAIVEEAPPRSGLAPMDYLAAGRVVQLEQSETLVLGYLATCLRESIDGGVVTIGRERSEVVGGAVSRTKVDCAGGSLQLSQEQAQQSGVMISRSLRPPEVHSLQPVFFTTFDGVLRIVRQDKSAEAVEIPVLGRKIVDLVDENIRLEAGGVYRAEIANKRLKFTVSSLAKPGKGELLSRLLGF